MNLFARRTALLLICCLGFLVWFRPIVAFISYTDKDDLCYLQMAANLIGESFRQCPSTTYPPGIALFWLPATLGAKFSASVFGTSFPEVLCILVGLGSWLYWVGALFLTESLFARLDFKGACRHKMTWSLILILNVPVLYYATHRTTLVHSPEFFLAILTIWLLIRGQRAGALISAIFLTLVRINDAPAILLVLASFSYSRLWQKVSLLVFVSATGLGLVLYGIHGHNGVNLSNLIERFDLPGLRLFRIFLGGSWGLLWTAPAWLLAVGYAIASKQKSRVTWAAILWMLGEFIVSTVWWGNGSDFGYRYLIGSYAAAFWIGYECIQTKKWERSSTRIKLFLSRLLLIEACWLSWLNWVYKERPEVTPYPVHNRSWIHPEQLVNSLRLLFDPSIYLQPLRHSPIGALYLTYMEPGGPDSLRSGPVGAQFHILLAVTLCAVFGVGLCGVLMFRQSKSPAVKCRT